MHSEERANSKDLLSEKETVDHPDHYQSGGYECIDVMAGIYSKEEVMTFCRLNAFKYLWRAGKKGPLDEDIMKAEWYLRKFVELEGEV
mgnify:CR=1 FL=1